MNTSGKRRMLIICAHLAAACGLGGIAATADAQTAVSLPANGSDAVAVSAMPHSLVLVDGELAKRVQAALHSDPYFYDGHVTVSVEKGAVVLHGFVLSNWDLLDALRIARQAAGDRPVIDNLSLEEGGRR
jgi:osmotically-inducible protein OsmY